MGARTGRQYIEGLRDQPREVWLGGERVKDVTTHPGLANGVKWSALFFLPFYAAQILVWRVQARRSAGFTP